MTHIKQSFRQGVYTIKNTKKYMGSKPPIFRSSWEMKFMQYLDANDKILQWCTECVIIPYSFNGKDHKYYPDFLIVTETGKTIVEIKPYKETLPPKKSKKKSSNTTLYESLTYAKNQAKWNFARIFCEKRSWVFKIITEKDIII